MLCDLDETVWERFDEDVCQGLAFAVVRAVARAARTPMAIGDHHLPAIPEGMTLADLDLEVRTLNCLVSAGIHERPQDLHGMTIEGILGLRGFWVKSLVDLLSSLEHVIDHPEARRAVRTDAIATVRHLREAHRYPRPHHRLAPQTLKEVLLDRVPASLVRGSPFRGKRLCDLDETAWEYLSQTAISKLANLVIARAAAAPHHRTIMQRRLPKPPRGMRLESLRLENRTHNCLQREGYAERPEDLGGLTVTELLSIRAFGAKCLVDLLTSLETRVAREGDLDEKLTAEGKALRQMPNVQEIAFSDPRLGPLLRSMDTESNTIGQMADRLIGRRLDPPDPARLREQIRELRQKISELSELPLEEELTQIFAPSFSARDRRIVAEYYGWDGRGNHTLEELGRQYDLSRERIRQICVRAVKRGRDAHVFAPVLDRTLRFLVKRFPIGFDKLQAELNASGLTRCGLPIESIRQAAEFLSRRPEFAVVDVGRNRVVVLPKHVRMPQAIVRAAKRVVTNYGAGTLAEVADELSDRFRGKVEPLLIRETLQSQDGMHWLDEKRNWFRLDALPQYGLPSLIEKVLSVTERIDVSKLRCAMARYRRNGRRLPPPQILLEFCRQMKGIRVEDNVIISDPPRDWTKVLTGVERSMVELLKRYGPVLERTVFEELCIHGGMNRFSFNAIVMSSPVVAQYGRSVYGLVGLKVDRKMVADLVSQKSAMPSNRVLKAFGETKDGKVYLAYKLSKAAISGGVVTVPAAVKRQVRGKFILRTDQGHKVGTLVAKKGCGWGLGPALRGGHAQQGDHMLLLLDTPKRQAHIHIGDENILNRLTDA
ncbi:MAG: hypothetical protein JXB62_04635 [Pirellulales bacterium]|nr:hypothetical protein [Pirellulales bacterium]